MAAWRFITTGDGAQCVMMAGISTTLMWCVASLASLVHPTLCTARHTVKVLIQSGWIMSAVKEERPHYLTVHIMTGEFTTVVITRMPVLSVTLRGQNKKQKKKTFEVLDCFFISSLDSKKTVCYRYV